MKIIVSEMQKTTNLGKAIKDQRHAVWWVDLCDVDIEIYILLDKADEPVQR